MASETETAGVPVRVRSGVSGQFEELKAWIAAKEAYEASTSKKAPLTDVQRHAMAELIRPRAQISIGEDEKWIDLLTRYRQTHPIQDGLIWTHEEKLTEPFNEGWTVSCRISEAPGVDFPPPDGDSAGRRPLFAKKQKAKQYAAQCAVQWLMENERMPKNGKDVVFKAERPPPGTPVDPFSDAFPATQRVPVLCHRLKFQEPRYIWDRSDVRLDAYDCEPDFGRHNYRIPYTRFKVTGVVGKMAAREKVADLMLPYMLKLEKQRLREMGKIMEGVRDFSSDGEYDSGNGDASDDDDGEGDNDSASV